MPSALFKKLVETVGAYIGPEKASGCVGRQLKHCGATEEDFVSDHLKKIVNLVVSASSLYVADAAKKQELSDRIKALA